MPYKAYFNWSGGKDSALGLYYARKDPEYKIERLLTNITYPQCRVSVHGVREELLNQQARAIGLPVKKIYLEDPPSATEYEEQTTKAMEGLKNEGFTHGFFGDIFLKDLRAYREISLQKLGLNAIFPLWEKDTRELLHEFIDLGFKAVIVCVNARILDKRFAGRLIDKDFLSDLPAGADPCGENGEFHSFVFDGPLFSEPVKYSMG